MPDNILLLQGPVGPFFKRLAKELESCGHKVSKVNFNGGDSLFYSTGSKYYFTDSLDEWPAFVQKRLISLRIDRIYIFGDCRVYHTIATDIAKTLNIPVHVFEEGYLRPNYITLEQDGVNGNSGITKLAAHYRNLDRKIEPQPKRWFSPFYITALYAVIYYIASSVFSHLFPHYQHHRPLNVLGEGSIWIKSLFLKLKYRFTEVDLKHAFRNKQSANFYLVALQVHSDMQIKMHSDFASIESFIEQAIESFASHAPDSSQLVIKHHPLDRGYRNYKNLIGDIGSKYAVSDRLIYVHDWNLPRLLKCAKGVVTINSTVGLSAIHHETPVITLGTAIYDMPGLTFQGDLNDFWTSEDAVDYDLYQRFKAWLLRNNQVSGNFYTRDSLMESPTCMKWPQKILSEHKLDTANSAKESGTACESH